MQRIAVALCTLCLSTAGTAAGTDDGRGHEIVQTQVASGSAVNDRVARLALEAAFPTAQTADLTRDEKIALLLYVSAARQGKPAEPPR